MANTINAPQKIVKADDNLPEFYTVEEIMKNLHIQSKTTMRKVLNLDTFPKIKIGRKILIPKEDYRKWVKNSKGKNIIG
jgi:cobalamin biosynthesis Co2+ chelatase CbiK